MAFYCQWPITAFTEISVSLVFASNFFVSNSSRRSSGCPRTISLDDRDFVNIAVEILRRKLLRVQILLFNSPQHTIPIFFSCDFNYTVCIWGYFSAKMNERKLWKARGVLIPQIHSAYLDRFVPHHVGHGIGRGLPNVRRHHEWRHT